MGFIQTHKHTSKQGLYTNTLTNLTCIQTHKHTKQTGLAYKHTNILANLAYTQADRTCILTHMTLGCWLEWVSS